MECCEFYNKRLTTQRGRILHRLKQGGWYTLDTLSALENAPQASVSAQLRNLRKLKYGGYTIERRHIKNGLYEYRMQH